MNAIPCSTHHSIVPIFHHSNILWDDSDGNIIVKRYYVANDVGSG